MAVRERRAEHRILLGTVAAAALTTVVVNALPNIQLAYRNRPLHVALEVSASFIGLLASYLFLGRFRASRTFSDLAVFFALVVMGLTNLFFSAVPAIAGDLMVPEVSAWASVGGRFVGAAALAFGAFARERSLAASARTITWALSGCFLMLSAILFLTTLLGDLLPNPVPPGIVPESSQVPTFAGDPGIRVTQGVSMLFLAAAAIGFARRSDGGRDRLMVWFASGAALGAFARVNYFFFPSLYSQWVYVGDLLRLGSYLFFLLGAAAEINLYWQRNAEAAVLEERRRLARDLHDGLAQEVTFLVSRSRAMLYEDEDSPGLQQIASAAENALYESRRAISALVDPVDEPLGVALGKLASEITEREGVDLDLDMGRDIRVPPTVQEQLLRIAREAMTNAARHGKPSTIRVELQKLEGLNLRLAVTDDGRGFDTAAPTSRDGGFGLVSMKERAKRLSGTLKIESEPLKGTKLEVHIPEAWT